MYILPLVYAMVHENNNDFRQFLTTQSYNLQPVATLCHALFDDLLCLQCYNCS